MRSLLDDLELDLKELKHLIGTITGKPDLKRVATRRIQEMHNRLDELFIQVDAISEVEHEELSEFEPPVLEEEVGNTGFDPVAEEKIISGFEEVTVSEEPEADETSLFSEPEKSDYESVTIDTDNLVEEELLDELAESEENEITEEADIRDEPLFIETVIETTPHQEQPVRRILGDRIKPSKDLRKSISLNDSFRYSRELFGDNISRMNKVIQEISHMETLSEVLPYLYNEWETDDENEAAADFLELLKKYFD